MGKIVISASPETWNCQNSKWVKYTVLGRIPQSKALINVSYALFRDPENYYTVGHILQRAE